MRAALQAHKQNGSTAGSWRCLGCHGAHPGGVRGASAAAAHAVCPQTRTDCCMPHFGVMSLAAHPSSTLPTVEHQVVHSIFSSPRRSTSCTARYLARSASETSRMLQSRFLICGCCPLQSAPWQPSVARIGVQAAGLQVFRTFPRPQVHWWCGRMQVLHRAVPKAAGRQVPAADDRQAPTAGRARKRMHQGLADRLHSAIL